MDQLPEVILLLFVIKYSGPKKTEMSEIFDILDNTRGLQLCPRIVACMAREVMESFLSFLVLSIKQAFELPDFGTVAQVNGVS